MPVKLKDPDGLRKQLRKQAEDSLYFFCKAVLGFKDLSPDLHMRLCAFLENKSFARTTEELEKFDKLVELSRGHLKTTICTVGYTLWRVCRNRNIRILLVMNTATNASQKLGEIAGHIEGNEMLRRLFPEIIPDFKKVKWTGEAIEVNRERIWPEATVEAIGVGGKVVSRHYDLIIKDDMVSIESGSDEDIRVLSDQIQKAINWHQYSVSLFISPAVAQQIVVGTRWAFNDLIGHIENHELDCFDQFRYGCTYSKDLEEGAKPLWPERFPLETLRQIRKTQGAYKFACQYMNKPTYDDPNAFDLTIIRQFDLIPQGPIDYFTAIDPAIGESKGADYSAIVTVGRMSDYDIFCVEAKRGHWGVDKLMEEIFKTYSIWNPLQLGLETIMFQRVLLWPLREMMRRTGTIINVVEIKPGKKDVKTARIATLRDYFVNGTLWLRSKEIMPHVYTELEEFPVGTHDDVIDALASAVQLAQPATREIEVKDDNPLLLENIMDSLRVLQGTTSIFKSQKLVRT